MNLRPIESKDLQSIFDVRAGTRENRFSREALCEIGITEESVARMLGTTHRGWLSEGEGKIAGFAIGDGKTGELWVIAVLPEFEKRGIGSQLLAVVEEWLASLGWKELWLWTSSDPNKRAYSFYANRGWMVSESKADIVYMKKKPASNRSRLFLRPFEDRDLDDMHEVMGNREVMRFSLSGPKSKEETALFISQCRRHFSERGYGLLAVVHTKEDRVIGYCGFYRQEIDGREELEIGYRLNPKYWGQGIASEAAAIIRDMGFICLGRERLISIIEPENKASIGVARKIGMAFERDYLFRGHRPVHIYSIRNIGVLNQAPP